MVMPPAAGDVAGPGTASRRRASAWASRLEDALPRTSRGGASNVGAGGVGPGGRAAVTTPWRSAASGVARALSSMRPAIVVGFPERAPAVGGSVRLTRTGLTWAISNLGETAIGLGARSGGAFSAGARAPAPCRLWAEENAALATTLRLRVSALAPLTSPMLRSARILVLRAAAVEPPKTTPSTCLRPRRTEATKLKPEARV